MMISSLRGAVSGFALCLVLGCIGGFGQPLPLNSLKLDQSASDIVWDRTRSRFFASVGTNVLVIDPETAQVEDTIAIGNPSYRIAVSDDGQCLYVALGTDATYSSLGIVNRYRIQSHSLEMQIHLGIYTGGNIPRGAQSMVVLPGQPTSILAGMSDHQVKVFDGAVPRPGVAALNMKSLYVRPSDGAIFGLGEAAQSGFGSPQIDWLSVSSNGVALVRSVPVDPMWDNGTVTWNGNLVANRNPFGSSVFDLSAGATIGHFPVQPLSTGDGGACVLTTDNSGTSAFLYQYENRSQARPASLVQYSLANFQPTASVDVTGIASDCTALTWGADGLLLRNNSVLFFVHVSTLPPVTPAPIPAATRDASGAVHLALPANGLIYDPGRNLLWASIAGNGGAAGNSVVSIDPTTGSVTDAIYAGSEPGALALSADGSHLFAALGGAPAIASVDLSARQSSSFSVLDPSGSLYWSAIGVATIGGQSNSLVAVRSAHGVNSSVVAYDAGIPRKDTFNNGAGENMYSQYVQAIFPADAPNAYYAADTNQHYSDGTHDVYRLTLDSDGVELDRKLNNLLLGSGSGAHGVTANNQPVSLVYDAGRLFTSAGQVHTPDAKHILGSVALTPAYGLPVPFSEQNGVVYVQSYAPKISANFYDLETFRPQLSLPLLTGPAWPPAVNVAAAVRAGSDSVAIAANGEIVIAPLTIFQPWPSPSGSVMSVSPGIQQIDMPVNAIEALPGTGKLLLATPSAAGAIGNSIVVYDPAVGAIETAAYIGSEPSLLAASPDGASVYARLSGEYRIGRLNVASRTRDLVFVADPTGAGDQYLPYDLAVGADGGLAVSYYGGAVVMFDNGTARPKTDLNDQGGYAGRAATFDLAFNDNGSLLYGFNNYLSTFDFKRCAVSSEGVQWLSSAGGLISGYYIEIRFAGGLVYASNGTVVDPERSRVVGRFVWPNNWPSHVVPDLAANRVYFSSGLGSPSGDGIAVFDMRTHAFLGSVTLPLNSSYSTWIKSLVQYSSDGLAATTMDGHVFLIQISSIPLLGSPVPSPQPPSLPITPFVNVNVIDLTASDLAYDSSRDLLYASVPNSEGAIGDHIVALDPATGAIRAHYATDINPRLLALSEDLSELYFTSGAASNWLANGYSFTSESARKLDLAIGVVGPRFATLPSSAQSSYSIADFTVPQGQPQSLALIQNRWENVTLPDGETLLANHGPTDLQIYDSGTQRPKSLGPGSFNCSAIQPGANQARLYCASTGSFSRLAADSNGVSVLDSFPLPSGNGAFTGFLFRSGRAYTTTGLVIDPEAKQVVARMQAQGPVAVDGGRVYWLDSSASIYPGVATTNQSTVALRSFDSTTLLPLDVRLINVTATDLTRLVPCGQGRLAFRAGHEIYVVSPSTGSMETPVITQVSPNGSPSSVVQPGSWISIYGRNLASGIRVWNNDFPTSLGGVSVTVNGKPAYLSYVSPTQIIAEAPNDSQQGLVTVVVNAPNGSASATVLLSAYSPAFFLFDPTHVAGIIPTSDGSGAYGNGLYDILGPAGLFNPKTRPVKVGETLEVYGTGFGPIYSATSLNYQVTISVGGVGVVSQFSGMMSAGIYKFRFVVPKVASGDQLVRATVNGNVVTPPAYVAVQ